MNKDELIYFHTRLDQNYIFAKFRNLKHHHKYYFDKKDLPRNIFAHLKKASHDLIRSIYEKQGPMTYLQRIELENLDLATSYKSKTTI